MARQGEGESREERGSGIEWGGRGCGPGAVASALDAVMALRSAAARASDVESFMTDACRVFVEVMGYSLAWIGVAQRDASRSVRPVARYGANPTYLDDLALTWADDERGRGPTGTALREGHASVNLDSRGNPLFAPWRASALRCRFHSSIALPFRLPNGDAAAVTLYASEANAFGGDDIAHLTALVLDLEERIHALGAKHASAEAAAALADAREQLRVLAENVDEAFWIEHANGPEVAVVSLRFEAIFGLPAASLEARPDAWIEALHPEDRERARARERVAAAGYDEAYRVVAPSGVARWVRVRAVPVVRDGTCRRIVRIAENVRERGATCEDAVRARRLEALGQRAFEVVHDLNNLLAVISACGETLASSRVSDAERGALADLLSAVDSAAVMTRRVLDSCSVEGDERGAHDLGALVSAMRGLLERALGSAGRLEMRRADADASVRIDPGALERIVLNLVVNARDAMVDGGVVRIETGCVDFAASSGAPRAGTFAFLAVSDDGMGIPPELLPKIFDPFFTTKAPGEGTGLGLATVRRSVEEHGGFIEVASDVGRGTRFTVYLPAVRCGG